MKAKRSGKKLALLLALCMVLCALPFPAGAATAQTYQPASWDDARAALISMADGDTLDLANLAHANHVVNQELTVSKSITVTNTSTQHQWFANLYFIIQDGATLSMKDMKITNSDSTKSMVSGTGNLLVKDCRLTNTPGLYGFTSDYEYKPHTCIEVSGDVTVYGTAESSPTGGIVFSTEIVGMTASAERTHDFPAGDAIQAANVTVYGGNICGGTDYSHKGDGGNAIVGIESVTLKGSGILGTIDGSTPDVFNSISVIGGDGRGGGSGIYTYGACVINGGAVFGGSAFGEFGFGGYAVQAQGNVTIVGEKFQVGNDTLFGTYLFPGNGTNCPGVPIYINGYGQQILRVKDAQVLGRNEGTYAAACTVNMGADDIAIIDGSKIGWYTNIPIFSAGSYQITNPAATWGTLDNVTAINAIDSLVSPDAKAASITAKATIPEPAYTITIPTKIDAGELVQKAADDPDKIKATAFTVSATEVKNLFGAKKITVSISTADGNFELADGSDKLAYSVFHQESGGSALANNAAYAEFTQTGSKTGRIEIDQSAITRAGDYSGTLTFTIALENIGASIPSIPGVEW